MFLVLCVTHKIEEKHLTGLKSLLTIGIFTITLTAFAANCGEAESLWILNSSKSLSLVNTAISWTGSFIYICSVSILHLNFSRKYYTYLLDLCIVESFEFEC